MQLQFESTNVCNADCCFCPYSRMTRAKGTMSMALYRRAIDEAATIPEIDHITITGLGEPLLDRFIAERIYYARTRMPDGTVIDMFTNGTFLRPEKAEALVNAGIDVIYVSLNATSARKRFQVMKLGDYDKVVEHIHYAQAYCEKVGRGRVIVKAIIAKDLIDGEQTTEFVKFWKGDWDNGQGGMGFRHLEGNWAGDTWKMRTPSEEACGRALGQIMVLQDGRVSLCCFDAEGREILGDLNTQTIREVFNAPKALNIRTAHIEGRRNDIALCAQCTGI